MHCKQYLCNRQKLLLSQKITFRCWQWYVRGVKGGALYLGGIRIPSVRPLLLLERPVTILGPIFSKDLANQSFQFSKWFTVSCHANEVSHNSAAVRQMNVFVNECCLSTAALKKMPSHYKKVWFQWCFQKCVSACLSVCVYVCVCWGGSNCGAERRVRILHRHKLLVFHLIQHLNSVCTTWYHVKQAIATQSSE